MLREHRRPEDPRAWLGRAHSNLIRAKSKIPGVYLEDLCFDAQQAAEKALKALCIDQAIDFPYVHDLAQLITILQQTGQTIPKEIQGASRLTRYAVVNRYPGSGDPVTEEEHEEAVAHAERVVRWVEGLMEKP